MEEEKGIRTLKNKEAVRGPELLDFVFSWSFKDVLNKDFYKEKVKHIPETFSASVDYLNSFKAPLIEETRADFCSALECVEEAPVCEIRRLVPSKDYKLPKKLLYGISIKSHDNNMPYSPAPNDVILLTNSRLKSFEDLNKPGEDILVAFVVRHRDDTSDYEILSSKIIGSDLRLRNSKRLFATYMINLTTNMRIWLALNQNPQSSDLSLIQRVLHYDYSTEQNDCTLCCFKGKIDLSGLISSFGLDESQKSAILSSISMRNCSHDAAGCGKVKLIWGPPGTGKTKTVASLLFALLKLKCRTLTCAPTNIAVVQVAKRLMSLVLRSPDEYGTFRLGDIVLFGNPERMKIDDHDDLAKVFLSYRVAILGRAIWGWKSTLVSMISLLSAPKKQYNEYKRLTVESDEKGRKADNTCGLQSQEGLKHRKQNYRLVMKEGRMKNKHEAESKDSDGSQNNSSFETKLESEVQLLTFEEFVEKTFYSLAETFMSCAINLYTHLPTSSIPPGVDKDMMNLVDQLKKLESKRKLAGGDFSYLIKRRIQLLAYFERLYKRYPGPKFKGNVWDFCMSKACLIFCTASSSIKVYKDVEMVIIDEAAQLKEAESVIPLSISGLKNAVLIGDDRQLPAMVQSKVSDNANFGRSLFQRLAKLGKRKHLLNIQYRMHPSISLFPNREFYENKIIDAPHVKETCYQRKFLEGKIYGSYSFINVERGKESFNKGHSPRNVEEAAVIDQIIAKLFKGHCATKQKISVGVISPYKGQVGLIQEKIGKKYANCKADFAVSVRSVDGFQGGEEDVIIISTVRCNRNGAVGFLSNHQRTNVALTRARYCMWVVGNEATLVNSGSIWTDLVLDAKIRGCFYNANDYIDLKAMTHRSAANKLELYGSLDFRNTRWKVLFTDDYKLSIASIDSEKSQKQVQDMLKNIADGWRQSNSEKAESVAIYGVAAELLEQYKVDEHLYLTWTVDIRKEESKYTQVIKVWDILPASMIPKLAKELDILFGNYTVDFMNRCKYKSYEGNSVVPMSWPIHSVFSAEHLSDRFSGMHIRDDQKEESSTKLRSMIVRPGGTSSRSRSRRRRGKAV